MKRWFAAPSRAFSIVELVIGCLILGGALVPIYSAFISSSRSVSSSRLAYMAMQVARETVEELRQIPVDRLKEITTQGAIGGQSIFALTAKMRTAKGQREDPNDVIPNSPKYPDEYNRIKTIISIAPADSAIPADKMTSAPLIKVTLDVTWEEQGGRDEKQRPGMMRYVTYIGNHSIDPEVRE
jgi:hypothetical protein